MSLARSSLAALALACMATTASAQANDLYTYELIARPTVQEHLKTLMGAKGLEKFEIITTVAGPVERQDGWTVGRGCRPHMCDEEVGAIAIHDDGTLIAVSRIGGEVQVHGDPQGHKLPRSILDVMAGR